MFSSEAGTHALVSGHFLLLSSQLEAQQDDGPHWPFLAWRQGGPAADLGNAAVRGDWVGGL